MNCLMIVNKTQKGRREMFYLTILFFFYLYGVGHILVKGHSGSETGYSLPPLHGLLFQISRKQGRIEALRGPMTTSI